MQLPVFEGPFDLLLFFIEREELDIYDIPIAQISTHFFTYLQQMQELELDIAGDFVRVAARLMQIKARMLLPIEHLSPENEENEDPRAALAAQLLRYKQFKAAAEALQHLASARSKQYARGNRDIAFSDLQEKYSAERALQTLSLHRLLQTYRRCSTQHRLREQTPPTHQIWRYPYTVPQQKRFLLKRLSEVQPLHFLSLLEHESASDARRLLCIFNLLATLELWQQGDIQVQSSEEYNTFYLQAAPKRRAP